ncbi:MAG: hypothetical protein JWQ94_1286 [Tardiphaga sp.]|nr:hypothetical protein [Tardiphaga sp.]
MQNPFSRGIDAGLWLDRKLPRTKHALVLAMTGSALYAIAHFYELPPYLLQFGLDHRDWEIDDLIFVVFMLSLALLVFDFRRYRELSHEITARARAEAETVQLARHDPLTGLPNRRFFEENLLKRLSRRSSAAVAVMMLDLDDFKSVNDTHGHQIGDVLLIAFARGVSRLLPEDAFLARIGGDRFAVILVDVGGPKDPADLSQQILALPSDPFTSGDDAIYFGVSIGIAIAPNDGEQSHEITRRADRALRKAKATGPSCVRFFEVEMDEVVERRALIERELRTAIAADAIALFYQPLVSLEHNRIVGFESLARWESPTLGTVSPEAFIRIAEECDFIGKLGDQLFRRACLDARRWPRDFVLAFNISPVQLRDPTLGLRLLSILAQTGLNPRQVEIEITESALFGNAATAKTVIDQLRQSGVRVALDDFGTGYSTLSRLLSLHLDKIKIDRSFVARLQESEDARVIVSAILGLARGLALTTTAEGIENAEQLALLKAHGCTEGQGYLFSKAIPASSIPTLLAAMGAVAPMDMVGTPVVGAPAMPARAIA